jgi:hypothetical protein
LLDVIGLIHGLRLVPGNFRCTGRVAQLSI